jgi:DNA helicase-2/ATP-dependent DNA helicase PcrA
VVVAAAGSGKTSFIVQESLRNSTSSTLITTYTIENQALINSYLIQYNSVLPQNVEVLGWWTFLLKHCVRPYQSFVYPAERIRTILRVDGRSDRYAGKDNAERYYFHNGDEIYSDKISEFACKCNLVSDGFVIKRLEQIYDNILIDESQELAGYDFEILELLMRSRINITLVGDIRQATYVTNYSPKNRQFERQNVIGLYKNWEANGLCLIEEKKESHRCNQSICDFADRLYPNLPKTVSKNQRITGHDGIFLIRRQDIKKYLDCFKPQALRYSRASKTDGVSALNFGLVQGQNFDRVMIFPTQGIKRYLLSGRIEDVGDLPKFYVAITRARYSVAIVHDQSTCFSDVKIWKEP